MQLASVASMIDQFNIPNIKILQSLGYKVDVAADFTDPGTITIERAENLKKRLAEMEVRVFDISIPRSLNPAVIFAAYKKVKSLLNAENYSLLHCHSPIGGVIARQAAKNKRKDGLKVIYTAHGFHFYNGAPLKNWLLFYPIEKHFSKYTDVLITINREDYKRASGKFKAKKTVYVPGVGVDTEKFKPDETGREKIRKELGISGGKTMLLSVGELNKNKNHEAVIRAIEGMDITYVIVGKGDLKDKLESIGKECNVDLRLMGFRNDVADFYDAADIYILPSIREGINVSLMEAMASGLPAACSNIRGNIDLINDCLFSPTNTEEIKHAIVRAIEKKQELGQRNLQTIRSFDLQTVETLVFEMYRGGRHLVNLLAWQQKRTEIGVPWNAKLLISVGELSVRKNHKVVVEALQELPDDYWYVIVGKGELKDELMALDHTGRLKLLGYRRDIVELLWASDLFVFPSLQEGLPVALMEAMASGINVVASHIRGNVDLIDENLVSATDAADWKQAIEKAMMRNSLNQENLKRIQFFSINDVDRKMKRIYEV